MRSERELLDIVYQRAEALRRVRRTRATVVLSSLAVAVVAAGVLAAGAIGGDDVLVAGPGAGEGADTAGARPTDRPPEADVGRLEIPAIDVDVTVVEGVSSADLAVGSGWYPETPRPGQPGNTAIAGHRTTYGAPFGRLDELEPGDEILVTTPDGLVTYEVREALIVAPTAVEVLGPTFWSDRWAQGPTNTLTLTTEHPAFSLAERLVVGAELIGGPVTEAPPGSVDPPGTELAPG